MSSAMSIKELARLTNVSTATVSRILNDKGGFSEETRRTVMSAVERYGYAPNRAAKSLRTNTSNVITLLLNDMVFDMYPSTIRAIQAQLQGQKYATLLWNMDLTADKNDELSYLSLLREQNISGVIYFPRHLTRVEEMLNSFPDNLPLICIDRAPLASDVRPHTAFIEPDNVHGGYLATRKLIELGCKRIGTLMVQNSNMGNGSVYYGRYLGYQQAMWESSVDINPAWALTVELSDSDITYNTLLPILRENPDLICDGYFCGSDLTALGLMRVLDALDVPVPNRVKIISFDDIPAARNSVRPLSTVAQPFDEMGILAAKTIVKMIRGEKTDFYHYLAPVELRLRATT